MLLVKNVYTPISKEPDLHLALVRKLSIPPRSIKGLEIVTRSIDARHRNDLKYNFTLHVELDGTSPSHSDVLTILPSREETPSPIMTYDKHPFIIGSGPAGLFCAMAMVAQGLEPYIFERGESIADRDEKVMTLCRSGLLDSESNIQFGEGGAGTYSDGKLTARSKDATARVIFQHLIQFGADPEVAIDALPHIGSDVLKQIITRMREYLMGKGCRFYWRHKLEWIEISEGKLDHVIIQGEKHHPQTLVLALGHSARDTFAMLHHADLMLLPKSFAVGMRIEHKQDFINERFYGNKADLSLTGPASYRLTATSGRRGVYSFCMCPGGEVVCASSEPEMLVTNGMSLSARDGKWANSAIVASVDAADYGNELFSGMDFQRMIERQAFLARYSAPAQKASDYLQRRQSTEVLTSYQPGIEMKDLSGLYPASIGLALADGIKQFDKRIAGFAEQGVFIGVETRTSSPIRILRDKETGASVSCNHIYPIGEGAGYAGGIISSAVDGYRLGKRFNFKAGK